MILDSFKGILPIETVKLEPSTCSERTCQYSESSLHSSWISSQVLPGCNCCVVDGKLVPDGFSWRVEDEQFGKNDQLLNIRICIMVKIFKIIN